MKNLLAFLFISFFMIVPSNAQAQVESTDTTLRLIEKNDGTKYIAIILSDNARELLIETQTIGKIYIPKSEVKRITLIENQDEIKNGELREESPFSTRYAFTNNALPIKRNDHYAMVNLFGPEVHFAVNDRLNLGVMTTWIGSPLIAVGKYTIPTSNKKVNFSIASMLGTSGYLQSFRGFGGLHWGTVTFGDRKNNISISGGFGYVNLGRRNYYWDDQTDTPTITYGSIVQDVQGEYTTDEGQLETYTDYQYNPETGVQETTLFEYFAYSRPNVPTETVRETFQASIVSIAGIFQLTSKASIFFDSMIGYGNGNFTTTDVSGGIEYIRDGNNVVAVNSSPYVYSVNRRSRPIVLYFMPGMRFQKNEDRAFQIAVAGVSVWDSGDNITFPLPLLSWFFKF